ncbi:hypothetical protein GQ53DRAFT_457792 [Thozetella sp. PMI_491]|nr:hypothetical protein GQ53DRAFT_457792 [Thozetella sp. PMI_491]
MDAKFCASCMDAVRDLFRPDQRSSDVTSLGKYSSISKRRTSCLFCAIICTGLRKAVLGPNWETEKGDGADAEICRKHTREEWENHYYDWGHSRWELRSHEDNVKLRRGRDSLARNIFVELGDDRLCYTAERQLKTRSYDTFTDRACDWQQDAKFLRVKKWLRDLLEDNPPGPLPQRVLDLEHGLSTAVNPPPGKQCPCWPANFTRVATESANRREQPRPREPKEGKQGAGRHAAQEQTYGHHPVPQSAVVQC